MGGRSLKTARRGWRQFGPTRCLRAKTCLAVAPAVVLINWLNMFEIFSRGSAGQQRHYLDMVGVTGSIPVVPTTQSLRTGYFPIKFKSAVCAGISGVGFRPFWSLRAHVVSGGDFRASVSASKNSVPGGQGSTADVRLLSHRSQTSAALVAAVFFGVRYCSGFNSSASNCRLRFAGASRSRSMLMPQDWAFLENICLVNRRVHFRQQGIALRSDKGKRRDERAGTDASDDSKRWPCAVFRPSHQYASAERTIVTAAGYREQVFGWRLLPE
jgi:hypothetical protein